MECDSINVAAEGYSRENAKRPANDICIVLLGREVAVEVDTARKLRAKESTWWSLLRDRSCHAKSERVKRERNYL